MKPLLLADSSVVALAETFKVLGDTTRVRILDAVSRAELPVGDIARLLGLSESAVSHQLRLLRGMRLVRPRRAGRMVYYTLDDQHIVGLFEQGLEHVEERRAGLGPRRESAPAAMPRGERGSAAPVARANATRKGERVGVESHEHGRKPAMASASGGGLDPRRGGGSHATDELTSRK